MLDQGNQYNKQVFDDFRKKFEVRLSNGYLAGFITFANFNTEVIQSFVDNRNWEGCKYFYDRVFNELMEHPKAIQGDAFKQDLKKFTSIFRKENKLAFERAFAIANQNPNVKALFYCFQHRNIDGIGRSALNLCLEYDPKVLNWAAKKLTKGHPRFRMPRLTVDPFDYIDMDGDLGKKPADITSIFPLYFNVHITLSICMLLYEIPDRNIPVGIAQVGEDITLPYISFI